MEKVAQRFPNASIVMLGKCTMDVSALTRYPNVHLLGRKPYADLPQYCKGFDVALIPFPISEVTLNANPLKAREYLAAGLPTVSTKIPEVEVLGDRCLIGNDHDDFCDKISQMLRHPGPSTDRSESIRDESWSARLDEVKAHVGLASLPLPRNGGIPPYSREVEGLGRGVSQTQCPLPKSFSGRCSHASLTPTSSTR